MKRDSVGLRRRAYKRTHAAYNGIGAVPTPKHRCRAIQHPDGINHSPAHELALGELCKTDAHHQLLRLESERATRATAVEGVNKILTRLEQLQSSVRAAVEPSR